MFFIVNLIRFSIANPMVLNAYCNRRTNWLSFVSICLFNFEWWLFHSSRWACCKFTIFWRWICVLDSFRKAIDYDINGIIPELLKNFTVSLTSISADGLITNRYVLSDFNATKLSYDNETHISTFEGSLNMITPEEVSLVANASFTLFEREIFILTIDPSVAKNYFGTTPIYGLNTLRRRFFAFLNQNHF